MAKALRHYLILFRLLLLFFVLLRITLVVMLCYAILFNNVVISSAKVVG